MPAGPRLIRTTGSSSSTSTGSRSGSTSTTPTMSESLWGAASTAPRRQPLLHRRGNAQETPRVVARQTLAHLSSQVESTHVVEMFERVEHRVVTTEADLGAQSSLQFAQERDG